MKKIIFLGLGFRAIEKMAFADSVLGQHFTSTNHYTTIGVPLLVSYQTNWFSNLQLSLNTGIILNIASYFKGAIPSLSSEPIDIKKNNVYNQGVNATLYLSIDFSKKINTRADLFAEPWFNYSLKNMTTSFQLFNQKIHTSGLFIGVRYRLFKEGAQ